MKRDAELPILRCTHEFVVGLIPVIGKFPRDVRFTLGEKIERQALSILELLIRARYQRDRATMLEQANVELEVLRYLVRVRTIWAHCPPRRLVTSRDAFWNSANNSAAGAKRRPHNRQGRRA